MLHPTIKKLVFILFIISVSIFVIFFTRTEEQSLPVFAENIQNHLEVFGDYDNAIFREFNLGEYYTKIGEFDKALMHYNNVYRNYPNFPKGYIKLEALLRMKQIEEVLQIIAEQEDQHFADTDVVIRQYFSDIRK